MLSFCFIFVIPNKNNTSFVVIIKDADVGKVYNSQHIKKLSDLYTFIAGMSQDDIFGFDSKNKYNFLFFAILENYSSIYEKIMLYYQLLVF